MPKPGVTIIVRGEHNTGRTTMAILFGNWLKENGYSDVQVVDTDPLPPEQKGRFPERWAVNRERPVRIHVETVEREERDEHSQR